MKEHQDQFSIVLQCPYFGVSRSGYYAWLNARSNQREQQRPQRDAQVKQVFFWFKQRYGAPRIQRQLAPEQQQHNVNTIASSLQRHGLVAKAAKKFKATTNSKHPLPVAPNWLEQNFQAEQPNQKWVSDITYLWTAEGWLYLAVVIDLFSRQVIGWSMSEQMTAQLTCDALQMAVFRRKRPKGVICHSDRGSQYCSRDYQNLLKRHSLVCSMSAKGNCYDNACAESFFHSLKVEAIHGENGLTRQQMKQAVFEYIETDYNRVRLHSNNGYRSPLDFEARFHKLVSKGVRF